MEFIIYELKAAVLLAVFYMFYRLLLSRDTFHRFNRVTLLVISLLSLVLPLCVITVHRTVEIPVWLLPMHGSRTETVVEEAVNEAGGWEAAAVSLYIAGVMAVLAHTGFAVADVIRIILRGRRIPQEDGAVIVVTDRDTAPFSWMKYIVFCESDFRAGHETILRHEKAHVRMRHSWDLLFTDIVTAFQWFNPAVWMLRADLRALHEFEADDFVLRSGADAREYQYLLIRKAVGASGNFITDSFSHSTLKNRITMMLRKRSSSWGALKALYLVPLVGLSLAATAETRYDYNITGLPGNGSDAADPLRSASVSTEKKRVRVKTAVKDTIISVTKDTVITVSGDDGSRETIMIVGYDGQKDSAGETDNVTVYVNGLKSGREVLGTMDPETIESMSVEKDEDGSASVYVVLKDKDGMKTPADLADLKGEIVSMSVSVPDIDTAALRKSLDKLENLDLSSLERLKNMNIDFSELEGKISSISVPDLDTAALRKSLESLGNIDVDIDVQSIQKAVDALKDIDWSVLEDLRSVTIDTARIGSYVRSVEKQYGVSIDADLDVEAGDGASKTKVTVSDGKSSVAPSVSASGKVKYYVDGKRYRGEINDIPVESIASMTVDKGGRRVDIFTKEQ
ncbi:MAG: M56 family metallopeptidase [Bacteroidetes bacterium]|uniref:M56 family metallopeptidase n=1 Tax=Candidatus Cryptobacteroides merdavium TaxID=2840769 RepID=A0A9D9EAI3_9BACT|nr:M56 family metallopeptidase [Candidatus Cryptobacteroides merdavium]